MKNIITVIKFEYLKFIKSKSIIITTLILMLLLVVLSLLPDIIDTFRNNRSVHVVEQRLVAILDNTGKYSEEVLLKHFPEYEWRHFDSFYNIKEIIVSDNYELAIEINGLDYKMYVTGVNLQHFINDRLEDMIREVNISKSLLNLGLDREEVNDFFNINPTGEIITIQSNIQDIFPKINLILSALYMLSIFFGQTLGYSIVTEKSTKLMELLITSTKPVYLLFGKVLGIGLGYLSQVAVIGLTYLIVQITLNNISINISTNLFIILLFFILGFFLYSFIFAIIAVLCNSIEELTNYIVFPIIALLVIFFISMRGVANLDSEWVVVLSYIPLFSPMLMLSKVYLELAGVFAYSVSLIILIVTIIIFGYLSAKIFKLGVLTRGNSNKLRFIIKALRTPE